MTYSMPLSANASSLSPPHHLELARRSSVSSPAWSNNGGLGGDLVGTSSVRACGTDALGCGSIGSLGCSLSKHCALLVH
jgi:hypothetical protein